MTARSPRCAEFARSIGADPLGSAPHSAGFLLVEWPLPWPRDPDEVPALRRVVAAARAEGLRVQLIVPRGSGGASRVVTYRADLEAPEDRYRRREWSGDLQQLAGAALDGVVGPIPVADAVDEVVDVLVCGHGKRDACCGSGGTALAVAASASGLDDEARVRVWRTSHLGGHRFAPTALVLPTGTMWAFADVALLERVVHRVGDPASVLDRYRGSTLLGAAGAQALERVAFAEIGWAWERWAWEVGEVEGRWHLRGWGPEGDERRWEAVVTAGAPVPVPDCGAPVEVRTRTQAAPVIAEVRSMPEAG
ncbi:MAG: hypothetical protein KDA97_08395 [Acidimicrobiales bacterium]|nr:hypothetical protein [Acidimicrobiales bacterium]